MKKTTRKYTRKEDANALQVSGGLAPGPGHATGPRGGAGGRGKRKRAGANMSNNSLGDIDTSRTIIASNPFDDDILPMQPPPPHHHINQHPPGMLMMGPQMQQHPRHPHHHHSPGPPPMALPHQHSGSPHSYPMGGSGPPYGPPGHSAPLPPPPPPHHMQQQYPHQMPMGANGMRGSAPPPPLGPPHGSTGPPTHMQPPVGPPFMSTPPQHLVDGPMDPSGQQQHQQPQSVMVSPPPPPPPSQRMYNQGGYQHPEYASTPPMHAPGPGQMGPQMHQMEPVNHRHGPSPTLQQQARMPPPPPTNHQTAPPPGPPTHPASNHQQQEPYHGQHMQSQAQVQCVECRQPIYGTESRIMCQASCEGYYHRNCSGLTELACEMLRGEPAAEWACNRCIESNRMIPVVKMEHQNACGQTVWMGARNFHPEA